MKFKIPHILALLILVLFLGGSVMGMKEQCKAKASRCVAHSDCCSNVCLPVVKGNPRKYCKVDGKVDQPPPGPCAAKDATCTKASDCCSGICAGKDVKYCWKEKRVLRGSHGELDEDHEA
jgi:hypothetical protein